MKTRTISLCGLSLAALLVELPALAWQVGSGDNAAGDPDAGLQSDASPIETVETGEEIKAPLPSIQIPAPQPPRLKPAPAEQDAFEEQGVFQQETTSTKKLDFTKGRKEVGLNLAMAGAGDYFYLGAGASFDYYVINKLALGATIQYTHVFLNHDFGYSEPHTLTLLPLLKFVILQSGSIAPYLTATGGYQFEWGSTYAVNAWIAGGGAGVNVGITEHVALTIQLLALYYWYDDERVYGYSDDRVYKADNGSEYVCNSPEQCNYDNGIYAYKAEDGQFQSCEGEEGAEACLSQTVYRCDENGLNCIPPYNDPSDESRELFFPLITFGVSIFF